MIFCLDQGLILDPFTDLSVGELGDGFQGKLSNREANYLLVFYVGYILDDKNTLCNGYFLTGLSVLFRVFK